MPKWEGTEKEKSNKFADLVVQKYKEKYKKEHGTEVDHYLEISKSSIQTPFASSKKPEIKEAKQALSELTSNVKKTLFTSSSIKKRENKENDTLDMPSLSAALEEVEKVGLKPSTTPLSPSSSKASSRSSSRSNSSSE